MTATFIFATGALVSAAGRRVGLGEQLHAAQHGHQCRDGAALKEIPPVISQRVALILVHINQLTRVQIPPSGLQAPDLGLWTLDYSTAVFCGLAFIFSRPSAHLIPPRICFW